MSTDSLELELLRLAESASGSSAIPYSSSTPSPPRFRFHNPTLNRTVILQHIPCTATSQEIRGEISRFGRILGFDYFPDKLENGTDAGLAIVTLASEEEAAQLVSNSINLLNTARPISVSHALDKTFNILPNPPIPVPSCFWREHASADGFAYYHNEETGETVWEKPPGFIPGLKFSQKVQPPDSPPSIQWSLYVFEPSADETSFLEKSRSLLKVLEGRCTRNFLGNLLILTWESRADRERGKEVVQNVRLQWGVRPGEE